MKLIIEKVGIPILARLKSASGAPGEHKVRKEFTGVMVRCIAKLIPKTGGPAGHPDGRSVESGGSFLSFAQSPHAKNVTSSKPPCTPVAAGYHEKRGRRTPSKFFAANAHFNYNGPGKRPSKSWATGFHG